MLDTDIRGLVERLNGLGLLLSAVPLADGSLRLNQWRTVRYYENETLIRAIWTDAVLSKPGRQEEIAKFVAPRPALRLAA